MKTHTRKFGQYLVEVKGHRISIVGNTNQKHKMTYEIYISSIESLEADAKKWSYRMKEIRGGATGPMGLTPDVIKFSPEYQNAKRCYNAFHNGVRKLNTFAPKAYLKRRASERRALRFSN
jgi:hypothetical protein